MSDKVALITGGSSGLGFAMAKRLGNKGYKIILLARRESKLQEAIAQMKKLNIDATYIRADVTQKEDLVRAREFVEKNYKGIDFLILNAGVVSVKLLNEYPTIKELRQDIEIDLLGVVQSAYYFESLLRTGAKVLLISSALGLFGMAGYTTYSAAKAGVLNFGDAWRRELINKNINLYVATPADIDTPQFHYEMDSHPQWMKEKSSPRKPHKADYIAKKILSKCKGKYKFLIIPTSDVKLLYFLFRILPISWKNFILDKIFPIPNF